MKLYYPEDRKDGQRDLIQLASDLAKSERSRTDYGQFTRIPYDAHSLSSRNIILSDETLGAISELEIEGARYDSLIGSSPFRTPLSRTLDRMEGVYTSALNGIHANYRVCCYLEHVLEVQGDAVSLSDVFEAMEGIVGHRVATARASMCACQIAQIMDRIFDDDFKVKDLTPGRITMLHDAVAAVLNPTSMLGLRTWRCSPESEGAPAGVLYQPPAPDKLPSLLEDLSNFLTTSQLGPIVKSAIVPFQLEATRMFSSTHDETGRFIAACLWKKAGLFSKLMPPISITPALEKRTHRQKLKPYLYNPDTCEMLALDEWVYLIARSTRNAVEVEKACFDESRRRVEEWRGRLEAQGFRATKAPERFLVEMIGTPVFSVSSMSKRIEASLSTTDRITDHLVRSGVVRQAAGNMRNRVFECPGSLSLLPWTTKLFKDAERKSEDASQR